MKVILKKFNKLILQNLPSGDADKINLKYTDSGLIKVVLISPKCWILNGIFSTEFPKGVDVTLYDDKKKTRVTAKYAVSYKTTGIIDLQGNVKIVKEKQGN
jgi:hypothetical protein